MYVCMYVFIYIYIYIYIHTSRGSATRGRPESWEARRPSRRAQLDCELYIYIVVVI